MSVGWLSEENRFLVLRNTLVGGGFIRNTEKGLFNMKYGKSSSKVSLPSGCTGSYHTPKIVLPRICNVSSRTE